MIKPLLLTIAAIGAISSANAITVSLITQSEFEAGEGSEVFSVRSRDFGNSNESAIFLGKGDLDDATNRVEGEYDWLRTQQNPNPFAISYNSLSGIVKITVGVAGAETIVTQVFEAGQMIDRLTVHTKWIEWVDRIDVSETINGVEIQPTGYTVFMLPGGDNYYSFSDLPAGDFEVTGNLYLRRSPNEIYPELPSVGDGALIEIKAFGSPVPDAGSTALFLGIGVLALVGARKRFAK